mgnify:CR=1 FL=1
MRKVYKQPTIKVMKLRPRTTMLTISQFPDKGGILDEEGKASDYD